MKRLITWLAILLLAACGAPLTISSAANGTSNDVTTSSVDTSSDTATKNVEPTKKDFKVVIKITQKDCQKPDAEIGYEGTCYLTYRADLVNVTGIALPEGSSYDVIFNVNGLKDQIGTITTEGGKYGKFDNFVSTGYPAPKLSATITDVNRNY